MTTQAYQQFYATEMEVLKGTHTSGTVADLREDDANEVLITETATTPGFTVVLTFSDFHRLVDSYKRWVKYAGLNINLNGWYEGTPAHEVKLSLWNYITEDWDEITSDATDLDDEASEQSYEFFVDPHQYMRADRTGPDGEFTVEFKQSRREMKLMIDHISAGSGGDKLHLQYLQLAFTSLAPKVF